MLKSTIKFLTAALIAAGIGYAPHASAAEQPQEWNLLIPTGVIKQANRKPAPRPSTLDGKTVALRWNSKNNGDLVLNRLAELFSKKLPNVNVVKIYEKAPDTNIISGSAAVAEKIAKAVAAVKPDLVIASQCD